MPGAADLTVCVFDEAELVRQRLVSAIDELPGVTMLETPGDDFSRLRTDIAIVDIHVRDGDGIRRLHAIKQLSCRPVVIVFTAGNSAQSMTMCRQAGADFFFDKAKDFEQLLAVLEVLRDTKHE